MKSKKSYLRNLWNLIFYGNENPYFDENKPQISPSLKQDLHMEFLSHYSTKLTLEIRNLNTEHPITVRAEVSTHIKSFPCFPQGWTQFWEAQIAANNKGGAITNHALIGGFCRLHIALKGKKFILKEFSIEKENFTYTIAVDKDGNITVINLPPTEIEFSNLNT